MDYRTASHPQGACPRCFDPLTQRAVDGMRLDQCTKCGGVFLDVALTNAVVRGPSQEVARAIFALSQVREYKTEAVSEPLSCPECGAQMLRQQIPSAVCDVDVCPEHGTWFDAAEVYKVSKALAAARKHRHGG